MSTEGRACTYSSPIVIGLLFVMFSGLASQAICSQTSDVVWRDRKLAERVIGITHVIMKSWLSNLLGKSGSLAVVPTPTPISRNISTTSVCPPELPQHAASTWTKFSPNQTTDTTDLQLKNDDFIPLCIGMNPSVCRCSGSAPGPPYASCNREQPLRSGSSLGIKMWWGQLELPPVALPPSAGLGSLHRAGVST